MNLTTADDDGRLVRRHYSAWLVSERAQLAQPSIHDAEGRARVCPDHADDQAVFYLYIQNDRLVTLRFRCLSACSVPSVVTADLLCEIAASARLTLDDFHTIAPRDFFLKLGGASSHVLQQTGPALLAVHRGIVQFLGRSAVQALFGDAAETTQLRSLRGPVDPEDALRVELRQRLRLYSVDPPAFLFRRWWASYSIADLLLKLQATADAAAVRSIRAAGCGFPASSTS